MVEAYKGAISQQINIENTPLSLRVKNGLLRNGITTLYELINKSEYEISKLKYIGKGALDEIYNFLLKCRTDNKFWSKLLELNNLSSDTYINKPEIDITNTNTYVLDGYKSKELQDEPVKPVVINSHTKIEDIPSFFYDDIKTIENLSEKALNKLKNKKIYKIGQIVQYEPDLLFLTHEEIDNLVSIAINSDSCEIPESLNFDEDIKIVNEYLLDKGILHYPIRLSKVVEMSLLEYTIEDIIDSGWLNIIIDILQVGLNELDEEHKEVLMKRLGLNCKKATLDEIGNARGVTRERIRQIEKKSLNKIQKFLEKNGYFDFINKISCRIFTDIGTIYKIDDIEKLNIYLPFINKFENKYTFSIDDKFNYLVKKQRWFDVLKENIDREIENGNEKVISRDTLLTILKDKLLLFNFNENELQIQNFSKILNEVKSEFANHFLIKVDNNHYKVLQDSKLWKSGRIKTDDRNDEIISLFATTYPEGVHLPIDKRYVLEKNLKALTDKLPYEISIRTLSDGIIKSAKQIILWDRGIYRHIDTIQIKWSAVDSAIDEILSEFDNGNSIFSIKKIYDNNEELYLNAGIPNYTALLGLVKYRDNPRIGNSKLEVFDIENEGDNINKTDIIEQYLFEAGDWVSIDDMQKHFCDELGWENYQVEQYVYATPKVKKDHRLGYIHTGILRKRVNWEALNYLMQQINKQVNFTKEPMKLENLRKSSYNKIWVSILNADVSGNFMSDFINSLIKKKDFPLLFYQGSAYSSDYKSEDLVARFNVEDVIKNYKECNYSQLYSEFEFFDKELLDKIMRSHIKIANVLFDKNLQDMCDYFYNNNINDLGTLLFFPFNCIEFKKQFTDSQIKKTIKKVYSWVESFEDNQEEGDLALDISSIFWRN